MQKLVAVVHAERPALPSRRWMPLLLIGVVVLYLLFLIVAPLAALIYGAFASGLGATLATFSDPDVQAAFWLTAQIAVVTAVVNGVFGVVIAWVLVRYRVPGRTIINALIDLPFALSPVVVGYMLILLFGRLGPLSSLEDTLNIQIVFAPPGMVLATLFVTMPFMIRELIPVIEGLDREQEHAAETLGARASQTFWLVTLPAIRWGIVYGLVLTFARSIGEFGAVLVAGGGIQGLTETAPLYIYRALGERNYTSAYTVALALGIVSLLLVLAIEQLRKRERKRA
jgi:sulfate transport system permease protein